MAYNSEYDILKEILGEIGGDTSQNYDSPYQIQLAILDAVKGGGGGGGAHIDDNNVSTGTVFSSAKCEGTKYYDMTTGFFQQIDLYTLYGYAETFSENTSVRYNMRNDDLYLIFDFYTKDSHQTFTLEDQSSSTTITTDDIAFVVTFYNLHNQASEIDQDGRYFQVFVEYKRTETDNSPYMYVYKNNGLYNPHLYTCNPGTNLIQPALESFGILLYGWDGSNHNLNSWGTIRFDSGQGFTNTALGTNDYGTEIIPACSNETVFNNVYYMNMSVGHQGGYVKWDETLFTPDNDYGSGFLKMPIIDKCGVVKGLTQAAQAVSINFNGQDYLHYRPNWASQYTSSGMVMYAPTTAGTAGYYLVSSGDGAPVWQELEVASDYVIEDADASAGIYSESIADFYTKTMEENIMQGVQIKITTSHNVSTYEVSTGIDTLSDGDLFTVIEDEAATIVINDGSADHNIVIDASGNITDADSTGAVSASNVVRVDGGHLYEFNGNSTYSWVSITDDVAFEVTTDSSIVTSDSFYSPSSSRIYGANVELWLMTTENGVTWENIHYLITNNSITRDVSTGDFGPDVSNKVSFASVTQAEYDALVLAGTVDPQTLYYINDAQ